MKYKVGDKITNQNKKYEIAKSCSILVKKGTAYFVKHYFELKEEGKTMNHEDTIMNLNELNTTKSRQIERLVKYIALDFQIDVEGEREQVRKDLFEHIRDEDLVNMIMFHVRKGK